MLSLADTALTSLLNVGGVICAAFPLSPFEIEPVTGDIIVNGSIVDRPAIRVGGVNFRAMGPSAKRPLEDFRIFGSLKHLRKAVLTDHDSSEGCRTDRRSNARRDQSMIDRVGKHLGGNGIYILR